MEIRILSFNIRHGRGMDDLVDLGRILEVISGSGAEIICLQEVDRALPRSEFVYQSEHLASELGFHHAYHANFGLLRSGMGNAIITKFPIHSTWNTRLPFIGEPRGLLQASMDVGGRPLTVFCTHWGLTPGQRRQQSRVTLSKVLATGGEIVLCGDLNASRPSVEVDSLLEMGALTDSGPSAGKSYPTNYPVVKIDYVLTSRSVIVVGSELLSSDASDHLPLLVSLSIADARD